MPAGRDCALPRRKAGQRAHLLGPGVGSCSTGITGSGRTARGGSGNRGEIGGPDTTVEPTDSARSRGWGLSGSNLQQADLLVTPAVRVHPRVTREKSGFKKFKGKVAVWLSQF